MNTNISINNNFKLFDDYILISTLVSGLFDHTEIWKTYLTVDFLIESESIVFRSPDNNELIEVICSFNKLPIKDLRDLACKVIIEFYEK